jgi:Tol biopolymer transport system component
MLVSVALPTASAKKPPKPPPEEPPADPAIAFFKQTSGPKENQIVVMNDDGTNQAVIYEEYFRCWGTSWSPDAKSLAWSGYIYVPNVPGANYGVWRIDVDVVDGEPQGSNLQQLASGFFFRKPTWSPLGDKIAFPEVPDGPGQDELRVVPATGGESQTIYTSPTGFTMINSPTWNSAGTHIAFIERDTSNGHFWIKVVDTQSGLTTHEFDMADYYIERVDWARQGSNILAFYDASPAMIFTMDIDTETIEPVTNGIAPSWSPDNSGIVFQEAGRKPKISIYEFSTGEITGLTSSGTLPDWRRF